MELHLDRHFNGTVLIGYMDMQLSLGKSRKRLRERKGKREKGRKVKKGIHLVAPHVIAGSTIFSVRFPYSASHVGKITKLKTEEDCKAKYEWMLEKFRACRGRPGHPPAVVQIIEGECHATPNWKLAATRPRLLQ